MNLDRRPRSVGQNRESLGEGEEQSLKQKVCPNRYAKALRALSQRTKRGEAATTMAYCGANATILVSRRGRGGTLRKQD